MAPRPRPDSAARLRALTRRAYTATSGHLDLDDDVGREFDRIVSGEGVGPARSGGVRRVPGAREGDPRGHRSARPRRWVVSGRAVVVALAVIAALAGAVVARAIALGPTEPVPVPEVTVDAAADRPADSAPPVSTSSGGPPSGAQAGAAAPDAGGPEQEGGTVVVVHVAGAVREPGVVELPAGARVTDAVAAAGGAEEGAELAAVNLARPLQDGEQVYLPREGEEVAAGAATGPAAPAGPAPAGGTAGVVDLNTADLAALDTLPGVGPAIAQRILDWRAANGAFHTVDELLEVPGIGPATLERLRELVRV